MAVLEARGLGKTYARRGRSTRALDQVDLAIQKDQLFTILGRNGAGKTTFIKIAATLLLPSDGELRLFGHDVVAEPKAVRPLMALVPQEGRPFFHMTPREHIREYLRVRGASREAAQSRTDEILDAMDLRAFQDTVAFQLSGGLQQRTLVAMVLATEAPFLFLDEPTLGMDPFARRQVWKVVRRAVQHGSTVLLTTHYLDEAEQLSDELAVFEGGKLVYQGTSEALKSNLGREVRLQFFGGFTPAELEPYGKVFHERDRLTLLTTQNSVRELTDRALSRGREVTVGPVTLEEAFLELVGRGIEEDEQ
jgi:ABC-2 type transport system ATP-binding protein